MRRRNSADPGIFWAANEQLIQEMLAYTPVEGICGIGPSQALLLKKNGFRTALDFTTASEDWVRLNMSVVGLRLLNEINGIPAMPWEFEPPAKEKYYTFKILWLLAYKKI